MNIFTKKVLEAAGPVDGAAPPRQLTPLEETRKSRIEQRTKLRSMSIAYMGLGLLFPTAAISYRFMSADASKFMIILLSAYGILFFIMGFAQRSRMGDLNDEIQSLDFQIDIQDDGVERREMRAERILRINDLQLRRYYDLNLRQNLWVFMLGILCMLLGVGLVGASLFLVLTKAAGVEAQIITAALGAVGGLLTNYVAVIYLKMNSAVTDNLTRFHGRLMESQQLYLCNLLASRIADDKLRWDTLSKLSLRLVQTDAEADAAVK